MNLQEWQERTMHWSEPAYRGRRVMIDKDIPVVMRPFLWQLSDYKVSSVSKGKIWLKPSKHGKV